MTGASSAALISFRNVKFGILQEQASLIKNRQLNYDDLEQMQLVVTQAMVTEEVRLINGSPFKLQRAHHCFHQDRHKLCLGTEICLVKSLLLILSNVKGM